MSILKPLSGDDLGLEENLRTFFEQNYPCFEILFAVRSRDDSATAVAERLRAAFPAVPSRLLVTGEPSYPNAKVFSLDRMLAEASCELLVMADSDVRVTPDLLSTLASEFQDEKAGLVTCPYRAVPGPSFWTHLEALGLNTEFLAGVLVARWLEGMQFALGPTIAARRRTLSELGGFQALKDYLAEDFVMGKRAAELGWRVILSSFVIEHRIGSQPFAANLKHRVAGSAAAPTASPSISPSPPAAPAHPLSASSITSRRAPAAPARGATSARCLPILCRWPCFSRLWRPPGGQCYR